MRDAVDNDSIDVPRPCLHDDPEHGVVNREQIEVGRSNHDGAGIIAHRQGSDLVVEAESLGPRSGGAGLSADGERLIAVRAWLLTAETQAADTEVHTLRCAMRDVVRLRNDPA